MTSSVAPTRSSTALGAAALLLLGAVGAAQAADASPWDGDARSKARLIAGPAVAGSSTLRAGIEIRLAPGWHTYWRYPGDAGVPPTFDYSGSENLRSVDVQWPAPEPLLEAGLTAIGYAGDVILPLRVEPREPGKPVALRVKLNYAVCDKLCVPAEATTAFTLAGGPSALADVLAAAEARVPKRLALGDGHALSIRSVHRDQSGTHVVVDVAAPADAVLFAEGETSQWSLPVPARIDGAPPGLQRFEFELDGAPPGASYDGAAITLTLIANGDAIEVATHLD